MPGKGFKHIYTCNDLLFDDWSIYMLKSDQSYLQGTGTEGSSLRQPRSSNGYRSSACANDHNRKGGLGGWFAQGRSTDGVNGALWAEAITTSISRMSS